MRRQRPVPARLPGETPPPPPIPRSSTTLAKGVKKHAHTGNNNGNHHNNATTEALSLTSSSKPLSVLQGERQIPLLLDLYAQDTFLGYQSSSETRSWWIRMPTYRKRNLTKQINTKRITKAIFFEIAKTEDTNKFSLGFQEVEQMIINHLLANKDFMAGVSSLFIASIGAPLQPEWHETSALFLRQNLQQKFERYGKLSVLASSSHQLIHRSGYIDLSLGNDFLYVADLFVVCAVREMEHKLTYNYLFSIWSIGSMLLLFLGMTYSIVTMYNLHPMIRLLFLTTVILLFAATRRKNLRKSNAAYIILASWALFIAWNAYMFSMLKFFITLLVLFPRLTLDFRLKLSSLVHVRNNGDNIGFTAAFNFINLKLLYLRHQIQYFNVKDMLMTILVWVIFCMARLSQQLSYPGLFPTKYESFMFLSPLLFPNVKNLNFGMGLGYFLQSILNSISFIYIFLRECLQCCCCVCCVTNSNNPL
jgi:hypothetical protein